MALTKVNNRMIDGSSFNVLDYGAVGDGLTDDTTSIQAAINAANTAGGGSVCFPSGTYLISSTLNGNDDIHLYADGNARIKSNISGTGGAIIKFLDKSNFSVKGLEIEGLNDASATAERGIDVRSETNTINSCTNFDISDNRIYNCYTGIKMGITPSASTVEGMVSNGRVYSNYIENSKSFGIVHFAGVALVTTSGNVIKGSDSVGISVEDRSTASTHSTPCRTISVSDNVITDVKSTSIKCEGSFGISIVGNTLRNGGSASEGTNNTDGKGIALRTISQDPAGIGDVNTVSGNSIIRFRQYGIQLIGVENCVVSSNTIKDIGIYRSGSDDNSARCIQLEFSAANSGNQGANNNLISNNVLHQDNGSALINAFMTVNDANCTSNKFVQNSLIDNSGDSINELTDSGTSTEFYSNQIPSNGSTLIDGDFTKLRITKNFSLKSTNFTGGSNLTFDADDGPILTWNPSAAVNLDPSGSFVAGEIKIVDNRSSTYAITFDSTGVNETVAAGKARAFYQFGGNWRKLDFT